MNLISNDREIGSYWRTWFEDLAELRDMENWMHFGILW
jgi:hypothetical protein